jgi:hypothetical protein
LAVADDAPRSSWDIVAEGQPPAFVLEVSSTSSWERDSEHKWLIYEAMGIGEYAVFAPERRDRGPKLFGYRLDEQGRYRRWEVDGAGVLWSWALGGLGLYVAEQHWVRVVTREGRRLPTPTEWAQDEQTAREAAQQQAEVTQRRLTAEVKRLRKELRRRGTGPNSQT